MLNDASNTLLLVVDMQPTFLAPIHEAESVLHRVKFLVEAANILGVPVRHTEQYPERMGGTEPALQALIGRDAYPKMDFSACGAAPLVTHIHERELPMITVCGIESHICVTQTTLDLLSAEVEVFLPLDAISARTPEMHKTAIKRLRDEGAVVTHSESVVYEWMGSADHPSFREVLKLVKAYSA